jgi:predicted nucleic acid-binding protein
VKVSLDSNILVYASHDDDPKHEAAVAVLARAAQGNCVQPLQSLGECFNVLTRKRGFSPTAARTAVEKLRTLFPIVAADETALEAAMTAVRDHKLQFWDAMLWATVRRAGCRVLFSEDRNDGEDIGGVKIVNPLKPENRSILDLALPPAES